MPAPVASSRLSSDPHGQSHATTAHAGGASQAVAVPLQEQSPNGSIRLRGLRTCGRSCAMIRCCCPMWRSRSCGSISGGSLERSCCITAASGHLLLLLLLQQLQLRRIGWLIRCISIYTSRLWPKQPQLGPWTEELCVNDNVDLKSGSVCCNLGRVRPNGDNTICVFPMRDTMVIRTCSVGWAQPLRSEWASGVPTCRCP